LVIAALPAVLVALKDMLPPTALVMVALPAVLLLLKFRLLPIPLLMMALPPLIVMPVPVNERVLLLPIINV
jgi:hypothetical protein